MAMSSLLLNPSPSFLHPKHGNYKITKLPSKPFTFRNSLPKTTNNPLSKDHNYNLSWKNELQNAYPNSELKISYDDDDEKFQEMVDKRCVDNLRMLIVDSVQESKAGHPGMALGMSEIGYFLYRHVLRHNPVNPCWFNRDRFVLSAGHGCLLQYVCLHLAGFHSVQSDSRSPENTLTDGIEVTTVTFVTQSDVLCWLFTRASWTRSSQCSWSCSSEAHLAARFNKPDVAIVDHRTYCIMGDGCAMEGISHEAASLAAHWKLNKLTLIYDDNNNTIDGPTDLAFTEDISLRFEALGWNTITVDDTHSNMRSFKNALWLLIKKPKDQLLSGYVKTRIGKLSKKEGTSKAHHGVFDEDDEKQMKQKVKWDGREPFLCDSYGIQILLLLIKFTYTDTEIFSSQPRHGAEYRCAEFGNMRWRHFKRHSIARWRFPAGRWKRGDGSLQSGGGQSRRAKCDCTFETKSGGRCGWDIGRWSRKGRLYCGDNSGTNIPELILIGTGSELCLCEDSARVLRKEGRRVRVVSLVCWRLFDKQVEEYKEQVLPPSVSKRVSVERDLRSDGGNTSGGRCGSWCGGFWG
ncbi:hypothetical protein DH2020_030073 [Rehmannia glutinosa]|uniref:Transketolase n=1 Tax=Rehmannia glutinosa TaxID=99300 RepID=A0ABR0VQA3_REHGL